jgi:hypothetical protein
VLPEEFEELFPLRRGPLSGVGVVAWRKGCWGVQEFCVGGQFWDMGREGGVVEGSSTVGGLGSAGIEVSSQEDVMGRGQGG